MKIYSHSLRVGEGQNNGNLGPWNLTEQGIDWEPLNLLTHHFYFERVGNAYDTSAVNLDKLAEGIEQCKRLGYSMQNVCLNIEAWHFRNGEDHEFQYEQFRIITEAYRDAFPGARFGYYALMPTRNYWAPVKLFMSPLNNAHIREYGNWQKRNAMFRTDIELAHMVDTIQPSLYMLYESTDEEQERRYLKYQVIEAQKYGKPCIYWVWPCFHDSNRDYKYTYVGDERWEWILNVIKSNGRETDGIVLLQFKNDTIPQSCFEVIKRVFPESKLDVTPITGIQQDFNTPDEAEEDLALMGENK